MGHGVTLGSLRRRCPGPVIRLETGDRRSEVGMAWPGKGKDAPSRTVAGNCSVLGEDGRRTMRRACFALNCLVDHAREARATAAGPQRFTNSGRGWGNPPRGRRRILARQNWTNSSHVCRLSRVALCYVVPSTQSPELRRCCSRPSIVRALLTLTPHCRPFCTQMQITTAQLAVCFKRRFVSCLSYPFVILPGPCLRFEQMIYSGHSLRGWTRLSSS